MTSTNVWYFLEQLWYSTYFYRTSKMISKFTLKCIPIYIQQDATLHSLFISGNCSTCFGWYFHPSSEAHTTVSTASDVCHTVTAICHYRGRVGTGLSVLWVVYSTIDNIFCIRQILEKNGNTIWQCIMSS
jgi:hypothetical protein